jgi:hypothetical protein
MADHTEKVQKRIEEILSAAGYPYTVEDGRARVEYGSTAVFISAHQWQERYTIVELVAPVLQEVPASPALLERLNEQNEKLYFGKAYWRNDEVWLAHNLLGDRLDNEELIASVGILAVVADHLDDELKKKFGGRRFKEKA